MLERGLESLDTVLGVRPTGYRSPAFDLSANSTRLLTEYGFTYDSNVMGHDFELYRCRTGDVIHTDRAAEFGRELDLVEVPVSWTLDDFPFMEFAIVPPMVVPASADVEGLARRWMSDMDFMVGEVPHGVFTQTYRRLAVILRLRAGTITHRRAPPTEPEVAAVGQPRTVRPTRWNSFRSL